MNNSQMTTSNGDSTPAPAPSGGELAQQMNEETKKKYTKGAPSSPSTPSSCLQTNPNIPPLPQIAKSEKGPTLWSTSATSNPPASLSP